MMLIVDSWNPMLRSEHTREAHESSEIDVSDITYPNLVLVLVWFRLVQSISMVQNPELVRIQVIDLVMFRAWLGLKASGSA